jgi:hypothetical protein
LIGERRFCMEGIGSYCILKGGNRFRGSRKVTGIQSHGGRFEITRHRNGRNFVFGQPLKLTAVSQSSGIIYGLIWSQIQVSAPPFWREISNLSPWDCKPGTFPFP